MGGFELGLILSLTDKASAGINGAVASLNGLNNAVEGSTSKLDSVGKSMSALTSLGAGMTAAITAPIAGFVGKITQYGMGRAGFIENTHLAFKSIMGDAQVASDYMQEMLKFAGTSAYAYEDIASAAQNMLSSGIKSMDILRQKSDGTWTGIIQAIGDAAGATGSGTAGFQSMAQVLGNIKAEGKASGIRIQQLQRYGIQVSKIIGNLYNLKEPEALAKIKSLTADQFIADLTKGIEEGTKGINGVTGAMAGQMLAMQDTFQGAKENLVFALKTAGLELMGGYKDEFGIMRYSFQKNMTAAVNRVSEAIKNIAPLFQPLVSLFEKFVTVGSTALQGLAKGFSMLSPTMKGVLGIITTFLTLAGPGILFVGKVLGPAIEGFDALRRHIDLANLPIKRFAVGSILAYTAWKTNFLGIRDMVTSFTTHLSNSFNKGRDIAKGSADSILSSVNDLKLKGDFWSNMTVGFTKLSVVGKALVEMFNSKDGLTMSADTWEKARVLGVLPFIEGIQDLKYRFDNFKEGFKRGWESVANAVKNAFSIMSNAVKGTFLESAIDGLGRFFKAITNNDPDAWQKVGNVAGKIAPLFLSVAFAMKMLNKVSAPFSAVKSLLPPIFSKKDTGGKGADGLKSSFLGNPKDVVRNMKNLGIILIGTTAIITAMGIISKVPYFNKFLDSGTQVISKLFASIIPIVTVAGSLALVTAGLDKLGDAKSFAKGIGNFAILLGGMQLLITAMGAINSISGFDDFLNNGVETISKIGNVLKMLGSPQILLAMGAIEGIGLIGGPATSLSGIAGLAVLIGGLGAIITAFGAINKIPGIQDFISGGGDLIAKIFEQVGKIGGAVVKGFATEAMSSLPDIGTQLSEFADNVKPFLSAFKGVDASGIGNFASGLGEMMLTLTGNNILEFFAGEVDLKKVGKDLAEFGSSIKPFLDSMANVDDANITKAGNVLKMLGSLSGYSLKSGGLLQELTGNLDIAGVGNQLKTFASGMIPFIQKAQEVDEGGITKAQNILNLLQSLSGYQLKSGGFLQYITGDVDLAGAGQQLSDFISNASGFFTSAQSIDEGSITKGQNIISMLSKVASINDGDISVSGLTNVGANLSNFAEKVKGFYTTASGISDFSAGDKLIESASKASKLNALAIGGGGNLTSYGQGLVSFATSWNSFTTQFKGGTVSTAGLTAMGTALQTFGSKLTTVNSTVKTQLTTMVNTVKTSLQTIKTAFSNTKLNLPHTHIDVPHFSMSGDFNPKTKSVPSVSVSWYAKGGVFDSPSLIGVGEAGKEAVVPLERNTGWINLLANKLGMIINNQSMGVTGAVATIANRFMETVDSIDNIGTPVDINASDTFGVVRNEPVPVSTGNNQVVNNSRGNTKIDNSVTFASGSIIVNVQNASEAEAERLADLIMEKISWKQKMETIRNFADLGNEIPVFDI